MSLFDDFMNALGKELGIQAEHDADHAMLELDELVFDLYYDASVDSLLIISMVADLGDNPTPMQQAVLCKRLLKAQFCYTETASFSFGLSNNDQFVALQGLWKLQPMEEREFIEQFEKFVQMTKLWVHKLENHADVTVVPPVSSADMDTLEMLRV